MKENKVLILAFFLSIAVHTAILIAPNFSRPKVKQTPLVMSFQFVEPTFKARGLTKREFKTVRKKKIEESKKINKSQPKNPKQLKKGKIVKPLKKRTSLIEKMATESKQRENVPETGVAMTTESPKSMNIPLEVSSKREVAFEQNDIIPRDILTGYLNQIRLMLEKEKRYPFLARKNHWEGTVYIKFTILRNGGLKEIKITQSSGFEVLDKEAEAIIRRIPFPVFPKGLQLSQLPIEVPIVFRLMK